jgi:hypothetical protein
MSFEVKASEKPRSRWPFVVIGAVVVVVVVLMFSWLARQAPQQKGRPEARIPFSAAAQAYAPNVKFENPKMSRFANMLDQEVTYIAGDVVNQGDRAIVNLQVTVEFRNMQGKVILRQTRKALGARPAPIPPGGRRPYRLGFEQIPSDWNVQYPSMQVTGLVLR